MLDLIRHRHIEKAAEYHKTEERVRDVLQHVVLPQRPGVGYVIIARDDGGLSFGRRRRGVDATARARRFLSSIGAGSGI